MASHLTLLCSHKLGKIYKSDILHQWERFLKIQSLLCFPVCQPLCSCSQIFTPVSLMAAVVHLSPPKKKSKKDMELSCSPQMSVPTECYTFSWLIHTATRFILPENCMRNETTCCLFWGWWVMRGKTSLVSTHEIVSLSAQTQTSKYVQAFFF